MSPKSHRESRLRPWRTSALVLASAIQLMLACGNDDDRELSDASGAGTAGQSAGASGAPDSGNNAGSAGTAGAGGSAGSGASGTSGSGGASTGGSSGGDAQAPPPADGGGSIYAVRCEGESRVCGFPAAHCLGIQLPDGGNGFACSNQCQTVADCSGAPSGAEARAGCVPFVQQSRCVLVCESGAQRAACPSGMTCYRYPGAEIGYCLWI